MVVAVGCGKKDKEDSKKGDAIGAPQIEPPVANNLPTSMKLWDSYSLQDGEVNPRDAARNTVLSYMSATGDAVTPTARLKAIDDRVKELDQRSQSSTARKCLATDAADFSIPGTIPGGTFPMKFQCKDDLDGGTAAQMAFGIDATDFYLYERNNTNSKVSVLAKAPKDGSSVEVWQIGVDSNVGASGWAHIRGSNSDGGIEISTAGEVVAFAHAMVCGVQVKTKGDLIYIVGKFASGSGSNIACSETMTFCLDATGAEMSDASKCAEAGLDKFALAALSPSTAGVEAANAKKFFETLITGVEDFNVGVEVEGK